MREVASYDTNIEIIVRKKLFSLGYRYRLHDKSLPCKPDVVLKKHKSVIFINGCFWHGHSKCSKGKLKPRTNAAYWKDKIDRNMRRDTRCLSELRDMGWKVLVIWECEIPETEQILKGFFAKNDK